MLVCHCARKTDRDIHAAVDSGARTCHEVARACAEAGRCCGGCSEMIQAILRARGAVCHELPLAGEAAAPAARLPASPCL